MCFFKKLFHLRGSIAFHWFWSENDNNNSHIFALLLSFGINERISLEFGKMVIIHGILIPLFIYYTHGFKQVRINFEMDDSEMLRCNKIISNGERWRRTKNLFVKLLILWIFTFHGQIFENYCYLDGNMLAGFCWKVWIPTTMIATWANKMTTTK